jgi:hypothetical protein
MKTDVDFIYTRVGGQRVWIQGRVKMLCNCDCRSKSELHPHADDFYLDSVRDVETDDRVILDAGEIAEIEEEAIGLAYEDVAS